MPDGTMPGAWLLAGRWKEKNLGSCQRQSTLESSADSSTCGVSPKMKRLRLVAIKVVGYVEGLLTHGEWNPRSRVLALSKGLALIFLPAIRGAKEAQSG